MLSSKLRIIMIACFAFKILMVKVGSRVRWKILCFTWIRTHHNKSMRLICAHDVKNCFLNSNLQSKLPTLKSDEI